MASAARRLLSTVPPRRGQLACYGGTSGAWKSRSTLPVLTRNVDLEVNHESPKVQKHERRSGLFRPFVSSCFRDLVLSVKAEDGHLDPDGNFTAGTTATDSYTYDAAASAERNAADSGPDADRHAGEQYTGGNRTQLEATIGGAQTTL